MRNRRTVNVSVCPICEMEIGPHDWADNCCPDCGWPDNEGVWTMRVIDVDSGVIVREFPLGDDDDIPSLNAGAQTAAQEADHEQLD